MKLLLDENLSRRLVPFLQHDYPGSNQVLLLGMESASDKEVWQRAKQDGYVIVTRDADFQELSLVWGHPPKVIRLKTLNQSRAATLKILIDNKDMHLRIWFSGCLGSNLQVFDAATSVWRLLVREIARQACPLPQRTARRSQCCRQTRFRRNGHKTGLQFFLTATLRPLRVTFTLRTSL